MPRYTLSVTESVRVNFTVTAKNADDALEKGKDGYFSGEYSVDQCCDFDVDEVLLEVTEENSKDGHWEQLYIVGDRKGERQSYPPREEEDEED
ncbi:MAG: hypothetical protein J6S27_08010 [Thermoguttaceae bacterium]|nr:hypothetical protein [Thermoguttaceae bacterium]